MKKILMYDKYDETYREVIDVKELKEYILKRIEELENQKRQWVEDRDNKHKDSELIYAIEVLQSFLKDMEVEDD